MKIRNGFVSNSSSSSFIIAYKKEISNDVMTEIFKIPEISPISSICKEIMNMYMEKSERIEDFTEWFIDKYGDYKEALEYKEVKRVKFLFDGGYRVYEGEFSSSGDGLESYLCDTDLIYESEDLVIYHEGGY